MKISAALQIAIDEYPDGNALTKCVADARDMNRLFGGRKLLNADATLPAILAALEETVAAARAGEWVVVWYSGHGTQLADDNGDEPDGIDEAIVDVELNCVRDDAIAKVLSQLRRDAFGLLGSDSCFSGAQHRELRLVSPLLTAADLPAMRRSGVRGLPASSVKAGRRTVGNVGEQPPLDRWVFFSGCADFEVSYEGPKNGVMTGAFKKAYKPGISVASLYQELTKAVKGWNQHPQLVCSPEARRWKLPSR